MRKDMSKVLTERPRHGRAWAVTKKTGGKICLSKLDEENDLADVVTRLPSHRRRAYMHETHKSLADHIKPLERYLKSKVGTPWDDVWSEICQTLDRRSMTGNHVFEHLRWMVELQTCLIDGEVYETSSGGKPFKVQGLYVHPVTRLLSYKPRKSFKYIPKVDPNIFAGPSDLERYTKNDGIWYLSKYRLSPTPPLWVWVEDTRKVSYDWIEIRQHPNNIHLLRISKRQLSTEELKTLGIFNTTEPGSMTHREHSKLTRGK